MVQLVTKWGRELIDSGQKKDILPEYPRPTMVRAGWQCLNGEWEYAFTTSTEKPTAYDGAILVPFAPETYLSGVQRQLKPSEYLWYYKEVCLSEEMLHQWKAGGRLLLHFGAVDQTCWVYINDKPVGEHVGGYLPFTIDIADAVGSYHKTNAAGFGLRVCVQDVSDTSCFSVGKQRLKPGGMYYTATSGIWQTVWLECVPEMHIGRIDFTPVYDEGTVKVCPYIDGRYTDARSDLYNNISLELSFLNGEYETVRWNLSVHSKGTQAEQAYDNAPEYVIPLPGFRSWSPDSPYLYQVRAELYREDILLDTVTSYFAMRKCAVDTDKNGICRIFLNNRPLLQIGVLDQGYWPESMYTPPMEEAIIQDIVSMKNLGFNMIRKHAKVEGDRWYYHCDRLGMLVWQDMVNGGRRNKAWYVTYLATAMNMTKIKLSDRHPVLLSRQDMAGRDMYYAELRAMTTFLRNHPSVVCYVPFNEGWGQFDTQKITDLLKELDNTRMVDQASGWFDQNGGDIKSLHYYFFRLKYKREAGRALALTEFGGYSFPIPEHCCCEKEYGYQKFTSKEELTAAYEKLMREVVIPAAADGISATVYTQLSDIEEEVNGIWTYDRDRIKISEEVVKQCNAALKRVTEGKENE